MGEADPIQRLNAALEGRYRLERELGAGGMATVYLAEDVRHHRSVALKVLKPELAAVVGSERFLAEIETTANLQHPHILPLFDSGEADGFLFYVMPHVEGESLRGRLDREHQLPVDDAVAISSKVASALDYAHSHGVIHRDIKPANILLSETGEPLVSDFGIALAVSAGGGDRLTETGLSLGTPYYMSPEQATGDLNVGPATDIYALGCVLYEMLVGEPPFTGSTPQSVLGKIITGETPSAMAERPSVPPNVDAVIAKALEKVPADRFASAVHVSVALREPSFRHGVDLVAGSSVSAARWRRSTVALGAVTLALGAFATASLLRPASPTSSEDAPLYLGLDLGDMVQSERSDLTLSPDGEWFMTTGQQGGWDGIYLRGRGEAQFRSLAGSDGARYPTFSPDSRWIAFRHGGTGALWKLPVGGGEPVPILPGGRMENALFLDWTRDDRILFYEFGDGVYAVPANGGEPEPLVDGEWIHPRDLPGGRLLLTEPNANAVAVLDPATGDVRTILDNAVDAMYVPTGHLIYGGPAGGLYAVEFDVDQAVVTSDPVLVLDDAWVGTFGAGARAGYGLSEAGTLVIERQRVGAPDQLTEIDLTTGERTPHLEPRPYFGVRWSPDGRSVAFSDEEHLWLYDASVRSVPERLTTVGLNNSPVWHPSGDRIAFSSRRPGSSLFDVYVLHLDDSVPRRLPEVGYYDWPSDWVDEATLVTTYQEMFPANNRREIWTASADGATEPEPYLRTEVQTYGMVLSPDRRWSAYVVRSTTEQGTADIEVRSFPNPGPAIPVSIGGGESPRWGPDGRLFYWKGRDVVVDTLIAAQLDLGERPRVLSREIILTGDFRHRGSPGNWDTHPDGRRIIVGVPTVPGGGQPRRRWLVIQNFYQDLLTRFEERSSG